MSRRSRGEGLRRRPDRDLSAGALMNSINRQRAQSPMRKNDAEPMRLDHAAGLLGVDIAILRDAIHQGALIPARVEGETRIWLDVADVNSMAARIPAGVTSGC